VGEDLELAVPRPLSKSKVSSTHWPFVRRQGWHCPSSRRTISRLSPTHSSSRFSSRPLPAALQPLPQTKQQPGQTSCLPRATKTTEAQTVWLPASGRRKFPHAPRVIRKGSGSACWQGPRTAKHLVFGSQDSAISLVFIRQSVSLQFSRVCRWGRGD